ERKLGVGEQYRELWARKRLRTAAALGKLHVVGQIFDRAVKQPACFQGLDETLLEAEILHAAPLGERQRQRLQVIVAQHQAGDFVGHLGKELIARRDRETAVANRDAQRDLDVDLHVRRVHAGGVVDRVGIEPD